MEKDPFSWNQRSAISALVYCQEAKPYKNDPEILAMTNLVNAYQESQS
jgi:hypothetical protein